MHKKVWVSVFFCLLAFSLGMRAQSKVPVIEFLYHGEGGLFNQTTLESPARTFFESSDTLWAFHVPPSPKSEAIIFDYGCQSGIIWWIGYTPQQFYSGFHMSFISDVIPEDIKVDFQTAIDGVSEIVHTHESECRTHKSTYKLTLSKDGFLQGYVFRPLEINYKSTGDPVPDEIANRILNALINKGFDIRVTYWGMAEGAREFRLISGWIQVTRATVR